MLMVMICLNSFIWIVAIHPKVNLGVTYPIIFSIASIILLILIRKVKKEKVVELN